MLFSKYFITDVILPKFSMKYIIFQKIQKKFMKITLQVMGFES
jgi:hypothetical protein